MENGNHILIELEDLANDINIKEIESMLHESIKKLNRINKEDIIKTKRQTRKEKRLKQKLERIWKDRESRKFWTSEMKFSECKTLIYKFYPSYDMYYYLR